MDTLFFLASKAFWPLAKAETWLLLLFGWSVLALGRARRSKKPSSRGFLALCAGTALLVALGSFPLGSLFLRPLEAQFPANPTLEAPAGIIILGGGEDARRTQANDLPHLNDAAERLVAGIALARKYPDALLVFTGGSAAVFGDKTSGSTVARRLFEEAGIADERILLEGRSRNTAENARLTLALLPPELAKTGRPWVLVTSAFHMPRALGTFCAAGWQNMRPWPVDYRAEPEFELGWDLAGGLESLNLALKEWIGLLAYRLVGHIGAMAPDGC